MIGEALALTTFYRSNGAVRVIVPKRDAIIITEVKLCKIAMQMLFGAMLIDAAHATLEN